MALDRALTMGLVCWEGGSLKGQEGRGGGQYLCQVGREDWSQDRVGNGLEAGTSGGVRGQRMGRILCGGGR